MTLAVLRATESDPIAAPRVAVVRLGENTAEATRQAGLAISAAALAAETLATRQLDHTYNLFDPAAVITGQEVYSDGTLNPPVADPGSAPNYYTSGLMPLRGATTVGIFGLGTNLSRDRYVRYVAADGVTLTGVTRIPDSLNAEFDAPPTGSGFVQFTPRNVAGSPDFGAVRVFASNAPWSGKKVEFAGDSITEMSDVVNGKDLFEETYDDPDDDPDLGPRTEYRVNYPYFVLPRILPRRVRLRAKAGAHFADASGLLPTQKFSTQVAAIIADGTTAGVLNANAPDAIIISIGTNDWGNSITVRDLNPGNPDYVGNTVVLGTAAAALAKDFGDLDTTISMDAMRSGLQNLRNWFPDAVIFGLTPMQRGDFNPIDGMADWVEEIRTMYRYYGCEIVDQFSELGVLYLFEQTAPGPHLSDKLHPSTAGMILQADLLAARYRARMGGTA